MQISSRLTIAIHIFCCIDTFQDQHRITSDFLASSINVNPVIIRNVLGQLKKAGLIEVIRGAGGAKIARELGDINMLDIYLAVESVGNNELFSFHSNPNQACPVGRNIHRILDDKLLRVQTAMERELESISLAEIMKDTKKYIA